MLSIMLKCLVLMIFKLPIESGERMSMGVTLLLSFTLFILMVNEQIPETSDSIPIIVIYLHCVIALTTAAIGESVLALWFYHHNTDNRAPVWLRTLPLFKVTTCNQRQVQEHKEHVGKINDTDEGNIDYAVSDSDLNQGKTVRSTSYSNVQRHKLMSDIYLTPEAISKEWRCIAEQCDALSFWVTLGIFVILILVLFIFIPVTQTSQSFTTVNQI